MRIAVTGASGFIGAALVPALAARGHEVLALDRAAIGDLAAVADWRALIGGTQAVVHLAALAHARARDEARLRAINLGATLALGEAAAAAGTRMVFVSSVKALGEESGAQPFDDSSAPHPEDAYGRAKADAERALGERRDLDFAILRPPLVYGPGVKANFLALMRAIDRGWPLPLAGIENRRSLIYVGNLCDAIALCVEAAGAKQRKYLLSDGAPVSTPELCRRIAAALGRPAVRVASGTDSGAQPDAIVADRRQRDPRRARLAAAVLARARFARDGALVSQR